ncbi:MAG: efflux RND transporter periplasmic adaptor subunit [Methylobacillus sp.]|jgi:RND family efflux transporter MFP subunit|nr:efflux RND transporter periplasmic adaptor subunit [Methylobacillus sp.]
MLRNFCIVFFGIFAIPAHAGEVIAMTPAQQKSLGIAVAPVETASGFSSHRLPGEIMVPVEQERVVTAPQPGLIDAVHVAPGQTVKKGQPLAHVSSPELVELQRDYLQALTQTRLAKNKADRDAELYKDGIIAERRYLESKAGHEELSALLSQRKQALRLAGMGDDAITRLANRQEFSSGLTITAPMAGDVLESMVTAGQRIDAMMPLFRIGHLTPLWLEIHAPVETLGDVKEGMAVRIPKYEAEGRVITIIRSINKNDQTMHIRAEIRKNAERLAPGQFVEAELVSGNDGQQFVVPRNAVTRNGADSYVFVQNAQGFAPLKITVLSEQADRIVFSGNLAAGSKVAVSGTAAIKAAWTSSGGAQ